MTDVINPINYEQLASQHDGDSLFKKQEYLSLIGDIEVELTVQVGKIKLTVAELQQLSVDQVLTLDTKTHEPITLHLNNQAIAEGELVQSNDHYGILIKNILVDQTV